MLESEKAKVTKSGGGKGVGEEEEEGKVVVVGQQLEALSLSLSLSLPSCLSCLLARLVRSHRGRLLLLLRWLARGGVDKQQTAAVDGAISFPSRRNPQSAAKLDSSSCCRGCSNRNSSNTVKGAEKAAAMLPPGEQVRQEPARLSFCQQSRERKHKKAKQVAKVFQIEHRQTDRLTTGQVTLGRRGRRTMELVPTLGPPPPPRRSAPRGAF